MPRSGARSVVLFLVEVGVVGAVHVLAIRTLKPYPVSVRICLSSGPWSISSVRSSPSYVTSRPRALELVQRGVAGLLDLHERRLRLRDARHGNAVATWASPATSLEPCNPIPPLGQVPLLTCTFGVGRTLGTSRGRQELLGCGLLSAQAGEEGCCRSSGSTST